MDERESVEWKLGVPRIIERTELSNLGLEGERSARMEICAPVPRSNPYLQTPDPIRICSVLKTEANCTRRDLKPV